MSKRIIFGLIGGLVMLLGFFEIQDYVPNTWGKTLDWLTEFDVWVVNNTADRAPFIPPFMSRICSGYGPVWTGL